MLNQFTQIPNTVFDKLLPHLKESELKVLLVILRQTNGWLNKYTGKRKVRDRITRSQFMKKTGLSKRAISDSIQGLIDKRLIRVMDTSGNALRSTSDRKGRSYLFYSLSTLKQSEKQPRTYKVLHIKDLL